MSAALPRSRHSSGNNNVEPRKLGKNVYILGSGFSAGMGIPTIARFVPDGLGLLKKKIAKGSNATCPDDEKLLTEVLGLIGAYRSIVKSVTQGEPTIQDYFCAVESADDARRRQTLTQFFLRVWELAWERHDCALNALREQGAVVKDCNQTYVPMVPRHLAWLHLGNAEFEVTRLQPDGQPLACAYEAFLAQILSEAKKDLDPAILSLNYDLLLENKLAQLQKTDGRKTDEPVQLSTLDYQLEGAQSVSETPRQVPYLKLHGSFNWQREAKTNKIVARDEVGSESVVTPGWVRAPFADRPGLPAKALSHLKTAQRIYIIGYSMAPIDLDVRYLLCQAMDTPEPPEIFVYSKMPPEDANRIAREFFGDRVQLGPTSPDYDLLAFLRDHRLPSGDTSL